MPQARKIDSKTPLNRTVNLIIDLCFRSSSVRSVIIPVGIHGPHFGVVI